MVKHPIRYVRPPHRRGRAGNRGAVRPGPKPFTSIRAAFLERATQLWKISVWFLDCEEGSIDPKGNHCMETCIWAHSAKTPKRGVRLSAISVLLRVRGGLRKGLLLTWRNLKMESGAVLGTRFISSAVGPQRAYRLPGPNHLSGLASSCSLMRRGSTCSFYRSELILAPNCKQEGTIPG